MFSAALSFSVHYLRNKIKQNKTNKKNCLTQAVSIFTPHSIKTQIRVCLCLIKKIDIISFNTSFPILLEFSWNLYFSPSQDHLRIGQWNWTAPVILYIIPLMPASFPQLHLSLIGHHRKRRETFHWLFLGLAHVPMNPLAVKSTFTLKDIQIHLHTEKHLRFLKYGCCHDFCQSIHRTLWFRGLLFNCHIFVLHIYILYAVSTIWYVVLWAMSGTATVAPYYWWSQVFISQLKIRHGYNHYWHPIITTIEVISIKW